MIHAIICAICGKSIESRIHNQKFCSDCKLKASKAQSKAHAEELKRQVKLVLEGKLSYAKIDFKTKSDKITVKHLFQRAGYFG